MKRFLQTKWGMLSVAGFTVLMAFMLHRVLGRQKAPSPQAASVLLQTSPSKSPKQSATPAARTSPSLSNQIAEAETSLSESPPHPADPGTAGPSLQKDLLYLDRLRESGNHSRTDRDREGVAVTRRRTAANTASSRNQGSSPTDDSALIASGKTLRLTGRVREASQASPSGASASPDITPSAVPSASSLAPISSPLPVGADHASAPRFVPYGRPIKCELVFTIDSTMEETPLVGLVVEPVHNNGVLVIPAGSEFHGIARPDRLRDRIFSGRDWVLVLPREGTSANGRQLAIKGLVLDRIEPQASGLTWGITDGSLGLQGAVIRTMESEEIKRFAATFVSAAALTLEERQTNSRGGRSVMNTPTNAALQGIATSLEDVSRKIAAEIERNGVFIRIAGGTQFYFYPQQTIAPDRATIPLTP